MHKKTQREKKKQSFAKEERREVLCQSQRHNGSDGNDAEVGREWRRRGRRGSNGCIEICRRPLRIHCRDSTEAGLCCTALYTLSEAQAAIALCSQLFSSPFFSRSEEKRTENSGRVSKCNGALVEMEEKLRKALPKWYDDLLQRCSAESKER